MADAVEGTEEAEGAENAAARAPAAGGAKQRDAFISYSQSKHAPLARKLQRGLERLAVSRFRPMRMSVFRDVTSLPANHDLWQSIQRELARSRYLILLASPEAAASPWVAREIDYWLRERDTEHLLIAVASGEIEWDERAGDFDWRRTTCLPRNLAGHFTSAPLWVDLREIGERAHHSLRYPPFRAAVATLASPLHGRPKEELEHDDFRQLRFVKRLSWSGVALLVTLLVLAVYGFFDAARQRDEAVAQARVSASQALAARSGQLLATSPNQAAQYALYAEETRSTPESRRALAQAVAAAPYARRRLRADSDSVLGQQGAGRPAQTDVVLSADGTTAAYRSEYDRVQGIRLYDVRSARQSGLLRDDSRPRALSRDGGILATEAYLNRIQLWDTRTGKLLRTVATGHTKDLPRVVQGLHALALSPGGRWVAASHYTPEGHAYAVVWNASSGREIARLRVSDTRIGLGFSADGSRMTLVDSGRREVREFLPEPARWEAARSLPGMTPAPARALQHSGILLFDGARKALTRTPERAEVWDLEKRRRIAERSLGNYENMTVAGGGGTVVVGGRDGSVRLYDARLRPGTELGRLARPAGALAASADGAQVAAGSYGGELNLYTTGARRGQRVALGDGEFTYGDLTPDGRTAVRRTERHTEFWDPRTGRRLGRIPYVNPSVNEEDTAYTLSGDKRYVGMQSVEDTKGETHTRFAIWDLRTGKRTDCRVDIEGLHQDLIPPAVFFLPGDRHVVGAWNGAVEVLDTRACTRSTVKPQLVYDTPALGLSGDRRTLVVLGQGTNDVDTWRWDGDHTFEHTAHTTLPSEVDAVGIGVDHEGKQAAFSDRESHLYVVRLDSGQRVRATGRLPEMTGDAAFSRDGSLVFQGFRTETSRGVRILDAASGDQLDVWATDPPAASAEPYEGMQVVPGPGDDLLTLGPDRRIVRRTAGVEAWRGLLCGLVSQPLPARERDRYLKGLDVAAPCR
ncbi:TIR domain-containing protein [Streptomyces sp. F63]|uniref:toll/interleukin-1 receptor domain-containing protein n=1 Tax=Streptomyces sp. F63 TaxID=2824887 RepID=UPI001B38FDA2|nr:TIR domain-containing protein [Streptomyces sp. F63]MBQ0984104.1 TIR domain-containing protein [Streptomyces sp. F63]